MLCVEAVWRKETTLLIAQVCRQGRRCHLAGMPTLSALVAEVFVLQLRDGWSLLSVFGQCLAKLANWPKDWLLELPSGLVVSVLLGIFLLFFSGFGSL